MWCFQVHCNELPLLIEWWLTQVYPIALRWWKASESPQRFEPTPLSCARWKRRSGSTQICRKRAFVNAQRPKG